MRYFIIILLMLIASCTKTVPERSERDTKYSIIKPQGSIYEIVKKNVPIEEITGKFYEKKIFDQKKLVRIERYDSNGNLTDSLNIPAVTTLDYDNEDKLKFVKYFNRYGKKAQDQKLKYWSKEIIYSNETTLVEIYCDTSGNLLKLPGEREEQKNFIAPVIVYLETENGPMIKAFDSNFNMVSEQYGEKPCIPFIDCGETENN